MKLDEYLKREGLSGPKFAERIGVNPATIYRIRNGLVLPHRRTIAAIVRETDNSVSIEDLVLLADDPSTEFRS